MKKKRVPLSYCLYTYTHIDTHTHTKPNPIGGRRPLTCLCNSKTCNRSLVSLTEFVKDKENQAVIKREAAMARKTEGIKLFQTNIEADDRLPWIESSVEMVKGDSSVP